MTNEKNYSLKLKDLFSVGNYVERNIAEDNFPDVEAKVHARAIPLVFIYGIGLTVVAVELSKVIGLDKLLNLD